MATPLAKKPAPCKNLTIRIPVALNVKIMAATASTGLKTSDVVRLAIERGIDRLIEQLKPVES